MPKTVFILGAGFSYPAGIPSQGELLSVALNYTYGAELKKCRRTLIDFITRVFHIKPKDAYRVPLEDIYTPLHDAVAKNEYLKDYSPGQLKKVENSLNRLISHVIDNGKIDKAYNDNYVGAFVEPLLETKRVALESDRFSIISLNWDILLDKQLHDRMQEKEPGGIIDYCCHTSGMDPQNSNVPAMLAPKYGIYTVKLLKIHGSLNWLTCPQCARLLINRDEKIGIKGFEGIAVCRFCGAVKLNPALHLPSFRKSFESFHFQHVWHQAAIELSNANRLVFIGYSFPLADFDFRTLVTKRVTTQEVEVVLWSADGKETAEGQRYRDYFGRRLKKIHYCGVENYIRDHFPSL